MSCLICSRILWPQGVLYSSLDLASAGKSSAQSVTPSPIVSLSDMLHHVLLASGNAHVRTDLWNLQLLLKLVP